MMVNYLFRDMIQNMHLLQQDCMKDDIRFMYRVCLGLIPRRFDCDDTTD